MSLTSPSSDSEMCTTHVQMPGEPALNPVVPCKLSFFKSLSTEEMQELITRLIDPIPSSVLVQIVDILLPVLTSMVNLSFMSGHFPDAWKEEWLFPSLKKVDLDVAFKNFRPISNLSFASKLSERAAANQLTRHVVYQGLDCELQSAYKRHYSTETTLLKVKNGLLISMDKQYVTLLVLLDLIPLTPCAITPSLVAWKTSSVSRVPHSNLIRSYLSGRTHRVCIKGARSETFVLRHGVPQGSCLVPLMFSRYTSKLFDITKHHLPKVVCYADDTQLYVSFRPDGSSGSERAIAAMSDCIRDLTAWMISDKLMINDGKSRCARWRSTLLQLVPAECTCYPPTSVRNLGDWFDSELTIEHSRS